MKSLFRCAATCRHWLQLFTDRAFLRQLWPETDRARLRGLFVKGPDPNTRQIFVPRPDSPLGFDDCHRITSLALDNHRDERDLLASSRGLILRQIVTTTCCFGSHTDIVISDPVTGARGMFAPSLDCVCLHGYVGGHAIFTDADLENTERPSTRRRHSTFSRLLLIGYHEDDQRLHQHVHSYSGVTGQWSLPAAIRHRARLRMTGARAGVLYQGAAHWLYSDETINVSVPHGKRDLYMLTAEAATGRVSLSKLPIKAATGLPYVCVSRDDRLSVACVHSTHIDVWVQQQDEDDSGSLAAWLLAKVFGKNCWTLSQVIQLIPATAPANENFMSGK
ncbi:hypothetical protein QOZ80_8AG0623040 [Eleusine coracana subsp. coracana]|nr:hypothetical protein QOZ80_8AG0623040 [Eleusine coracana subsp. coracana]